MTRSPGRLFERLAVRTDNPELLQAQCAALSRLIPLLYLILLINCWVLAGSFIHQAPLSLTLVVPLVLSAVCAARTATWWRIRTSSLTAAAAARELRRTNLVALLLSLAFYGWIFLLASHGNALMRSHIAFFLATSMIGAMLCLIHLPSAALTIAVVATAALLHFLVYTHADGLLPSVANVVLIAASAMLVILIHSRNFARMINAQTDARQREKEQERLLRMIDDMPVAVMTIDPGTLRITYLNNASRRLLRQIEHLLPVSAQEVAGATIDVFHPYPAQQKQLLTDPANLPHTARLQLGPEVLDLQISAITSAAGGYLWPMLTWAIVTREAEAENRIRQLALYDPLTGLANRHTFHEQLDEFLTQPMNHGALLFLDLDGFKPINDSEGHRIGDLLLRKVADRLLAVCGAPGMNVSRIGGDEFAVTVPSAGDTEAGMLARALVGALSAPFHLEHGRSVQIGVSIGIAMAPDHGSNGEQLLARADIALYAAKASGKGAIRMFSHTLEAHLHERLQIETQLRAAIEQCDRLFVFYQPIIDLATSRVTAREALVRWHHATRGWIPPVEFIPVAEQCGLIDRLGQFVLERACLEAARWQNDVRVAVNVSAVQLGKGTFVATVVRALKAANLPPQRLELEVTESALLVRETDGIEDLIRLRAMGVRIVLDDFGTGYSSLSHLRAFPFDKIKIDGSFVKEAMHRSECAAVVKAIADIGHRLSVTTVAEGVETAAQLERVLAEGYCEVQGQFLGRPAPAASDVARVRQLGSPAHELLDLEAIPA